MRFLLALLKALGHAIVTLAVTMLVQAVSALLVVVVMGQYDPKFGRWGTFGLIMGIALLVHRGQCLDILRDWPNHRLSTCVPKLLPATVVVVVRPQ